MCGRGSVFNGNDSVCAEKENAFPSFSLSLFAWQRIFNLFLIYSPRFNVPPNNEFNKKSRKTAVEQESRQGLSAGISLGMSLSLAYTAFLYSVLSFLKLGMLTR